MPILLNIDTATEHASVCLSNDEAILGLVESTEQKNHASFVQPAIRQLLAEAGLSLSRIDAVSATAGPGSYTGLRVGMASAKGICYAIQKPLILVNTLEVMAGAILAEYADKAQTLAPDSLLCPLIDARRMEVFTATYGVSLVEKAAPHALILDEQSFSRLLKDHTMVFSGSGHHKLKSMISSPNAMFSSVQHTAAHLVPAALKAYHSNHFADLAYSEPLYVKEFFDTRKKV